jgi:hypothetical protein
MLRRVALVVTDVSEELSSSFIRVTIIGELGTSLAVTSNGRKHPDDGGAKFLETSVLTRATRRNISEDAILHSHCREKLKSYLALTGWQFLRSVRRLLNMVNVSSSPILVSLMKEALSSSET